MVAEGPVLLPAPAPASVGLVALMGLMPSVTGTSAAEGLTGALSSFAPKALSWRAALLLLLMLSLLLVVFPHRADDIACRGVHGMPGKGWQVGGHARLA